MPRFLVSFLLLLASPAFAAIGPERVFPTGVFSLSDAIARGNTIHVVAQTSSAAVSVLTIDAAGQLKDPYSFAAYEAAIATNGVDTALITTGCARLNAFCAIHVTWLDANGQPMFEPAQLLDTGDDFVRVDVERTAEGGFLVAGTNLNRQQIWLARLTPRASTLTGMRIVAAEHAEGVKLAISGNTALLAWDHVFRRCFASSGCPYADSIVHARLVDVPTFAAGPTRGLSGERVRSVVPLAGGTFLVATTPFSFENRGSFITRVTAQGATEIAALPVGTLSIVNGFAAWAESGVNNDSNVYLGTGDRFDRVNSIATSHTRPELFPILVQREQDVAAVYIAGSQLAMRTIAHPLPELPATPAAPAVTSVTGNYYTHATVQWTPVANAKMYRVIATAPGIRHEAPPSGPERTSVEVTNLRGETQYEIRLIVEDENGRSLPSPPAIVDTHITPAPRPPSTLAAARNADGTWTLTWNDLSARETSYELRAENGLGGQFIVPLPANTTRHTLPLASGSLYTIELRAISGAGFDAMTFVVDTSVPVERRRAAR